MKIIEIRGWKKKKKKKEKEKLPGGEDKCDKQAHPNNNPRPIILFLKKR